ncbi:MAG: hypothetical protein RLO08_14350 [Parvibaculaceae bacterium]
MPKLQCKVPQRLSSAIADLRVEKDIKKGKALKLLLQYALDNPDHEIEDFGDERAVSCTLSIGEAEYQETFEYRKKHKLTTRTEFFLDALKRGASAAKKDPLNGIEDH